MNFIPTNDSLIRIQMTLKITFTSHNCKHFDKMTLKVPFRAYQRPALRDDSVKISPPPPRRKSN